MVDETTVVTDVAKAETDLKGLWTKFTTKFPDWKKYSTLIVGAFIAGDVFAKVF